MKRDKPALVFVNPASGAGKAYRLVMEYAVGVWGEAEFQHHIIMTGRLRNISRQSLSKYGVVHRICGSCT